MDGKVFNQNTKESFKKIIEEAIQGNVFVELIDGKVAEILIGVIDHYGDKFIPDQYDVALDAIANYCIEKQWNEAAEEAAKLINKLVDIPVLEENAEELIFVNGLKFLVSLILKYIENKKSE